jgi:hypothetical protein
MLTDEQLVVACRNIGFDLTCGACAGQFYTGAQLGAHTCPSGGRTETQRADGAEAALSLQTERVIRAETELAAARAVVAQARNISPRICGAAGVLDEKVKAYDSALGVKRKSEEPPHPGDPYFRTGCRCVIIANDDTAGSYCPVHGSQK